MRRRGRRLSGKSGVHTVGGEGKERPAILVSTTKYVVSIAVTGPAREGRPPLFLKFAPTPAAPSLLLSLELNCRLDPGARGIGKNCGEYSSAVEFVLWIALKMENERPRGGFKTVCRKKRKKKSGEEGFEEEGSYLRCLNLRSSNGFYPPVDRNIPVLKFISPVLIFANVPANGKLCGPVSSHKKVNLGPSIPRQGKRTERNGPLRAGVSDAIISSGKFFPIRSINETNEK